MELTIIGSGTGIPSKTRAYPCALVKVSGKHLVFDTGPGSLRQLFFAGVTYLDIDHLYYSHFHPDHSLDLVSILFAMRYNTPKRTKPLSITGPTGLMAFHEGLLAVYGETIKPKTYDLQLKENDTGELAYDGWKVMATPMQHSMHSIAYRITSPDGRTLVYSGDTDYCEGIIRLADRANTLLLECSFPDEQKVEGHLTPRLCARVARGSQCDRLILSHFYPTCDAAGLSHDDALLTDMKQIYPGEIIFGADFASYTI